MTAVSDQEVLISTINGPATSIGLITLNRPKALNALSFNMIKIITKALQDWQQDDNISAVVIRGQGERAFCAGGDIKSLYLNGKDNPKACMEFFFHEYRLNTLIKNYPKPYVALLHGITMGGGIGVSVHGSHKVAAQNLVFAMPESGIGFFTDIGGSYFLPRCPDYSGYYIALTGTKVNCHDAKYINLIDCILDSEDYTSTFEQIINKLANSKLATNNSLDLNNTITTKIINEFTNTNVCNSDDQNNKVINNIDAIKSCFNSANVYEIINKLEKLGTSWSEKTLSILKSKSPTSLLVIFELLKRSKELSFEACMQMEYAATYGFLKNHDFYEGVRAAIIDKDNSPNWEQISLENSNSFNYGDYFIESFAEELEFIS